MASCPQNSSETFVAYYISDDENILDALISAFSAMDFDRFDKTTTLTDWVTCDALDGLNWDSNESPHVPTVIRDHPVEVTPGKIEIYTPASSLAPPDNGTYGGC